MPIRTLFKVVIRVEGLKARHITYSGYTSFYEKEQHHRRQNQLINECAQKMKLKGYMWPSMASEGILPLMQILCLHNVIIYT